MNLTQFIFAVHKCILARVAMKNCAKWTDLRAITSLFKTNLAFLKEVQSQRVPAQNWGRTSLLDRTGCYHSQASVTFSAEEDI